MYVYDDNMNLEVRCRALWADILCAVESRVFSINDYARDTRTQLECQMISGESLEIVHAQANRAILATLDLEDHSIRIKEKDGDMITVGAKLPFVILGDCDIYVTSGRVLLGDASAVARQLMSILLANPDEVTHSAEMNEYRAWASALITARAPRIEMALPIEIQTEDAIHPASTVDLSPVGVKVESPGVLDRGKYVTIFRGSLGSFFRVVWSEQTETGTRAGLVCLNPPMEWAEATA